jgi:hypothetical protein
MDAGVGQELVDVGEPEDVADLGDESGRRGRSHTRDALGPSSHVTVEEAGPKRSTAAAMIRSVVAGSPRSPSTVSTARSSRGLIVRAEATTYQPRLR